MRFSPRAARGLGLGLSMSAINLLGAFLVVLSLGGLGEWTRAQFVGLFGVMELGTGLAYLIGPNCWRLPVAEANTPHTDVRLAASTLFIPHWLAGSKAAGGLAFTSCALVSEGVGPATPGLLPLIAAIVAASLGLSLVFARIGVARPEWDVIYLSLRRPGGHRRDFPGVSLGSLVVQFFLNVGIFPAVKLLPPSILYRPEMGPSPALLGTAVAVGASFMALGVAAWWGRMALRAPREQQREAERYVEAN